MVGMLCELLALVLKESTEFAEGHLFSYLSATGYGLLFILVPGAGLLLVWIFNNYIHKDAPNKGLGEVLDVIDGTKESIKPSRAVTHFFNGFFTVSSGGSTGIEVSTVIASSAIGNAAGRWMTMDAKEKKYLLIAGAAAGIAALFNSPLGGFFFAVEVLADVLSFDLLGIILCALSGAFLVSMPFHTSSLFVATHHIWRWKAVPFFMIFSLISAVLSTYMTKLVVWNKSVFIKFLNAKMRIIVGGIMVGIGVFFLRPLYGEGYKTIQELLSGDITAFNDGIFQGVFSPALILLGFVVILAVKPLITSVTLASGGDGGVFAPSLFLGAVTGLVYAHSVNQWIGSDLIEVNFIIVGMAALLSASIQAPLTAVFLTASITGNYDLLFPLLITAFFSKLIAGKILPYTVYSYARIAR